MGFECWNDFLKKQLGEKYIPPHTNNEKREVKQIERKQAEKTGHI